MTPEYLNFLDDILNQLFSIVSKISMLVLLVTVVIGLTALGFWAIVNEIRGQHDH